MRIFCPRSVATGVRLMQLDCFTQSPQPSQTSSWIIRRVVGSAYFPRERLRRFSAAHSWS